MIKDDANIDAQEIYALLKKHAYLYLDSLIEKEDVTLPDFIEDDYEDGNGLFNRISTSEDFYLVYKTDPDLICEVRMAPENKTFIFYLLKNIDHPAARDNLHYLLTQRSDLLLNKDNEQMTALNYMHSKFLECAQMKQSTGHDALWTDLVKFFETYVTPVRGFLMIKNCQN